MAVKTKASIIIIIGFIIVITSQYLSAIDAPHNTSHMNCGSCHGYEIFWVGTGSYDLLCQQCHWVSSCSENGYSDTGAPQVMGHVDSNGNAVAECRTCHDPHYQRQKNYKSTDPNYYYLAKGQFTACSVGSGTSTLTYLPPITYKTETGWDATRLIGKTDICRRTILFPNVNKLGYSYPIIAVDEGAKTITVKGNACEYLYLFPSNFAVIYGQYIKDSILTDEVNNTYSPVKFFDKIGQGSFAYNENMSGNDPTPNGVCQVCHKNTTHWKADRTGTDHYNNNNYEGGCIYCHPHTGGFVHGGGGGTDCISCHGTTGSHPAHVSTIACDACHVFNPFKVTPGAGYSFSYDESEHSCSGIKSDPLGSCHFNTDATWGGSACTGCHGTTENMGNRVNVMAQINGNSHHIQGTAVTGAHCYQCHWEANSNGTINKTYHGGSKASGSVVDLVIYGSGSRPAGTTYTPGVTGIEYTANGSRAQIKGINTHCLGCHSTQNNTATPFVGDIHTPKEYAWDGTSVDERYSQLGTTTWGKYGLIINETFERNPGYDETWTQSGGTNCSLNPAVSSICPDISIPYPPPAGIDLLGSQCLRSVSASPGYAAYATRDYGLEQPKTFTTFYLNVGYDGLDNGQNKIIGGLQDGAKNAVFVFRLNKDTSGQLQLMLQLYNNGTLGGAGNEFYINISTDWYKIAVKYDYTDKTWQWGVIGPTVFAPPYYKILASNSGSLTGTYRNGIRYWNFGFMRPGTDIIPGTIYFDSIRVSNDFWDGENVTPKKAQTKAYSAHGNATSNEGGWDLSETWPNTRNGTETTENIACFDCHNSHGSNISGTTTSYTSETTNGGMLKDTMAGKGGYLMTYKPQTGGSTTNRNVYNAGAGLCFDCHLTATSGTTPWGYNSPFGATQQIMGYLDTPYFGTGTSGAKQRFSYIPTINQGGHLGASSGGIATSGSTTDIKDSTKNWDTNQWQNNYVIMKTGANAGQDRQISSNTADTLTVATTFNNPVAATDSYIILGSVPMGNINGLCTPCHDPHGVTDNTDKIAADDKQYAIPLLKGTWLTSPYQEDRAPVNNEVGTIRTDRGKEDIHYYIDQNTFGSDIVEFVAGIQEPDSKFGGLCLNCHPKNSLTNGTTHTWKSKDRIHESVKGWKTADTTIQHNYPCSKCHTPHNARLPRLMVTNCLDYRHKGRMGNNPSPVISGEGTSSCVTDYLIECETEESITVGNCAIVKAAKVKCCGGSGCGARFSDNHGNGYGGIPGNVGGYRTPVSHSVTCHEGNDPNQRWNSKTPWTQ